MTSNSPSGLDLTHTFNVQSVKGLYLLTANKYIKVASATFLFLEIIETLPDEVNLVWPTKFGFAKVLFLFNKYSPLVDQILDFTTIFDLTGDVQLCLKRYTAVSWIYFAGVLQSESILLSRTIALWGWNTYVLTLLGGGGFGIVILCIYAVYQSNLFVKFPQEDVMRLVGCIPDNFDAWPAVACVTIGETAVIALTFGRWYQDRSVMGGGNAMFPTMYRDGALAYLAVGVISVVNVIVLLTAPPEFVSCMEMPLRVIHSTLCTRVLLNLRRSAAGSPGLTTLGTEQANAPTLAWELASIAFPENGGGCPIED
ncbi:hypothetical protein V8D89_011605 [Ganoderma adspersum]